MVRISKVRMLFAVGTAVLALGTVPHASAQPSGWLPLQLTGYNADVITDANLSVRYAQLFDAGCCAWFESGAVDNNGMEHDDGIPAGSSFQSMTGSGVNYLIQPAIYNNVLQVSNNAGAQAQGVPATGTLTLMTPAAYSQIAIFSSSGNSNGTATGTFSINYSDGSTQTGSYNTFDWCGGSNPLSVIPPNPSQNALTSSGAPVTGIGRVGNGIGAMGGIGFSYQFVCGPQGFEAYETLIQTDNTKTIVSVDFQAPDASTNRSSVFGISAVP